MMVAHRLMTALAATRATRRAGADDLHLNAAVDWLLASQRRPAQGYAHSYHFLRGWLPPYPETTGYIIPTMLTVARRFNRAEAYTSAVRSLHWLYGIQSEDGWFADLSGRPLVFDTGQILIGMNAALARSLPGYRPDAHLRTAQWLTQVQAGDGSFPAHAYNDRPHSYYSRVGAALLEAGQLLQNQKFVDAGNRNLSWTADRQGRTGFFERASFDDRPAYLHTIVYVLEGLLDGYALVKERRWLDAALICAGSLLQTLTPGSIPRSQYRSDWSVANPEYCVTGLAQWATVCYRLAHDHGEQQFLVHAERVVDRLKRWQLISQRSEIHGGLPGSIPVHGRYMRFCIPNWGVKFFIDALVWRDKVRTDRELGGCEPT